MTWLFLTLWSLGIAVTSAFVWTMMKDLESRAATVRATGRVPSEDPSYSRKKSDLIVVVILVALYIGISIAALSGWRGAINIAGNYAVAALGLTAVSCIPWLIRRHMPSRIRLLALMVIVTGVTPIVQVFWFSNLISVPDRFLALGLYGWFVITCALKATLQASSSKGLLS